MSFCHTITEFVQEKVLVKVEKWIDQKQKKCQSKKGLKKLFCWFVLIAVKIFEWVTRVIIVPLNHVICVALAGGIYVVIHPFAAPFPKFDDWLKKWFYKKVKCEHLKTTPASGGVSVYEFKCQCKNGEQLIKVEAHNDEEAAEMVRKQACP